MNGWDARLFDDFGPDPAEATVTLIDALRDYIKSQDGVRADFIDAGATPEMLKEGDAFVDQCRALLANLELDEVSPDLFGVKK